MRDLPDRPFLKSEIAELGITPAQLRKLLADHVVRRVLHGVFVRTDRVDDQALRLACARLILPTHAVVSDRSAAWLHGIDCYDYADLALGPRLEIVAIDGHEPARRPEWLGGKRSLAPGDICEIGGVLVTTPLRTACDIACLRGRHRALAVLDAFRRDFGIEEKELTRLLPRFVGRRGVIQLRELVPLSSPLPESMPESWTRMMIIDEQLPVPEPQVSLLVPDYGYVRLDLAYAELKIAVEYDGEEFHSSEEDKDADDARRTALRRDGWIVIVVRRDGFSGPTRDAWIEELRDALAERLPGRTKRVYSRGDRRTGHRSRRAWT